MPDAGMQRVDSTLSGAAESAPSPEPSAAPALSRTSFELPFSLPENITTLKGVLHHAVSQLRTKAVEGALEVVAEALKTDAWKHLELTDRLSLEMSFQMAAEELVVNSMYYGILRLDPDNKVALTDPSSLQQRVKEAAAPEVLEPKEMKAREFKLWREACRDLFDRLREPESHERSGIFAVKIIGDEIQLSIVDSGKFPNFHEVLADARQKLDDPGRYPHGRGLIIATEMFDKYSQDPESGAITFTITARGLLERLAELRRQIEIDRAAKEAA